MIDVNARIHTCGNRVDDGNALRRRIEQAGARQGFDSDGSVCPLGHLHKRIVQRRKLKRTELVGDRLKAAVDAQCVPYFRGIGQFSAVFGYLFICVISRLYHSHKNKCLSAVDVGTI